MSDLAAMHANYLAVREHTVNQSTPLGQARYVLGEAEELRDAVLHGSDTMVRHEIADVVLATVTLANMLGVRIEDCITEKTEADRGRG